MQKISIDFIIFFLNFNISIKDVFQLFPISFPFCKNMCAILTYKMM